MGYWNSRGLRGSAFEEIINYTNDLYQKKGLAVVQKVPTPITPVKMNQENKTITLAYFEKKSTVDYIGVVQGIPICFDAKETGRASFPIQNIHEHQIQFMADFEKQKGLAFLLVSFTQKDEVFLLCFETLKHFWDQAQKGGRKSIPYEAFDHALIVKKEKGVLIHYLEAINTLLCQKKI